MFLILQQQQQNKQRDFLIFLLVLSHLCTPLEVEDVNLDKVFSPREYKFHHGTGEPYKTTKPLKHIILQLLTNAMEL